ncbi:MAG: hypothetical protein ACFFDP_01980 [Promethearchaeota archaeon]
MKSKAIVTINEVNMLGKDKPPILEKVDDERTLTQKLMKLIPGWRGYTIKEERRNADRILRDQICSRLRRAQDVIEDIRRAVVEVELEGAYTTIESLGSRTERLISQIEHADYGYRPFFDAIKIKEDDLINMLKFDTWFVETVQEYDKIANDVLNSVENDPETAMKQIKELRRMITDMISKWKNRTDVILGVEVV